MSSKMFSMALMMGAMLSASGGNNPHRGNYESEEDRKKRLADAKIAQNKAKGLKEFKYNGVWIWALNKKSADKKAKKLNLI